MARPANPMERRLGSAPWVAEEAVARTVSQIVENGSQMVYRNHLERQSYPFAARSAEEAAITGAQMYLVPKDGTVEDDTDSLEAEPVASETDSWARHALRVRGPKIKRKVGAKHPHQYHSSDGEDSPSYRMKKTRSLAYPSSAGGFTFTFGKEGTTSVPLSGFGRPRAHTNPLSTSPRRRATAGGGSGFGRPAPPAPKSYLLSTEEIQEVDETEDRLRALKVAKTAQRKREAEEAKRRAEQEETERIGLQQFLEAEAARGPCTYDTEGRVIWVEAPNTDHLPPAQSFCTFEINPPNQASDTAAARAAAVAAAPAPTQTLRYQPRPTRLGRTERRGKNEHEDFTDGFYRPEMMQPPPLDVMRPSPGVTLECKGAKRVGPSKRGDQMTWREFEEFARSGVRPGTAPRLNATASAPALSNAAPGAATPANPSHGATTPNLHHRRQSGGGFYMPHHEGDATPSMHQHHSGGGHHGAPGASSPRGHAATAPAHGGVGPAERQAHASKQLPLGWGEATLAPSENGAGASPAPPSATGSKSAGRARRDTASTAQLEAAAAAPPQMTMTVVPGVRKAPAAPDMHLRMRKTEASLGGGQKHPRHRVAQLGAHRPYGPAQPPLGATMGHGLLCSGRSRDNFFYPEDKAKAAAAAAAAAASATPHPHIHRAPSAAHAGNSRPTTPAMHSIATATESERQDSHTWLSRSRRTSGANNSALGLGRPASAGTITGAFRAH